MTRARTLTRIVLPLTLTVLVAAGCGGGDDAAAGGDAGAAGTTTTAAPGGTPTTPGGTVGAPADPNAQTATDPVTGLAVAPSTGGATATIPDLSGGDVGGGLAAANGTGLFSPKALDGADAATSDAVTDTKIDPATPIDATPATTTVAAKFSGAVIYVDGTTYKVDKGASFPKGAPIFRLLSVSGTDVEIELIAGEFTSGGGDGVFIDKGELLTFLNSSEGVDYKVKYVRPIKDSAGVTF